MDILVGIEVASLYVEPYFLVGIAERHTVLCQTVDLFHGEDRVVHRIVEDVTAHLYLVDDVGTHGEAVLQFVKGREEHLFYYLKVAEIAAWEIVLDECHLCRESLYLVAFGTYKLENVRILLVRHDA